MRSLLALVVLLGCTPETAAPGSVTQSPPMYDLPLETRAQRLADELVTIARMALDLTQAELAGEAGGLTIQGFQPSGDVTETAGLGVTQRSRILVEEGTVTKTCEVRITGSHERVIRRRIDLKIQKGEQPLSDAERVQEVGDNGHVFIKTTYHFAWRDDGYRFAVTTASLNGQGWTFSGNLDRPSEISFPITVETQADGSVLAQGTESPMTMAVKVTSDRQVATMQIYPQDLIEGELTPPADD